MRTWRVGSFSMGASLLLLGICLLLTQLFHMEQATLILAWWPFILIILGIEITLYLIFSKQENTYIKYDFLSIFFVGCIGTFGIVLTLLSTTGILHKVNDWMKIEEVTFDLPEYEHMINKESIKRIVVHSRNHPITIENSIDEDISIFGTYRTQTIDQDEPITSASDYVFSKIKGDTLYVQFKDLTNLSFPFQNDIMLQATLIIPQDVALEVTGEQNVITVIPRHPTSHWYVNEASYVDVILKKDANMLIKAQNVSDLQGEGWANPDPESETNILKFGSGDHTLSIQNAHMLSVIHP